MREKSYSPVAGASRYPIRAGAVFRLHQTKLRVNRHVGTARIPHVVYIWVHSVAPITSKIKPKKRGVSIFQLYVPESPAWHNGKYYLRSRTGQNRVQFYYVGSLLRKGYDYLGEIPLKGRKFYYYSRFYKLIKKSIKEKKYE